MRGPAAGLLALALCLPLLASCSLNAPYAPARDHPDRASIAPACLPQDCFSHAVALMRDDHSEEAAAALQALAASYPDTDWSARASYLLGLAALDNASANDEAIALFTDAARLSIIEDRVLFNLAHAYAADGQFENAAALYDAMAGLHPDSVLIKTAAYNRAEALYNAGDYASARSAFDAFSNLYANDARARKALIASARASISLGQPQEAALPLHRLRIRHPSGETSDETGALISLLAALEVTMPVMTPRERLERGDAFLAGRRWTDAIEAYGAIDSPDLRSTTVLRSAEAMHRLKRYAESETLLNRYLNAAPEPSAKPRALRMLATSLIRQDKDNGLISVLKSLRKTPESPELASTLLAVARYYDDKGEHKTALGLYNELLKTGADSGPGREAAWSIAWRNYSEGRYKDAARLFSTGCDDESGRCLYWSGRAFERDGSLDIAIAVAYFRKACSGADASYYCRLAAKRMPDIAMDTMQDDSSGGTEVRLNHPLFTDGRYLAARELNLMGLSQQAASELDRLTMDYPLDADSALVLTRLFYQTGDIYRGLRTWRRYSSGAGASGTGPRSLSLAYPSQAVELAAEHSDAQRADPYLIASIMREESAFNPDALSSAGAVGMMQLMPSTARFIAKRTGAPDVTGPELLSRRTNILLGSRYLDYLLGLFNGNVIYAVAAYNAGPGAVRDWTQRLPSEPDEFIESIPYPETREYTKRVIAAYAQFLRMANDAPKGRFSPSGFNGFTAAPQAYRAAQ